MQECLLIQINRKQDTVKDKVRQASMVLASSILEDHYDAFTKKHYSQIIAKLEIDEDVLKITGKREDINKSFIKNDNINKSFYLPEDVIINKIKAKTLNGILYIEIPKLKKVKSDIKKIQIS